MRVQRARVILSLIGIGVAVASLTSAAALGEIAGQTIEQNTVKYQGKLLTLQYMLSQKNAKNHISAEKLTKAVEQTTKRFKLSQHSRVATTAVKVQFANGVGSVRAQFVDPKWRNIHAQPILKGRWFTKADEQSLAPKLVIDENFYKRIGKPALTQHPTIEILGQQSVTAIIIGVMPSEPFTKQPAFISTYSAFARGGLTISPATISPAQQNEAATAPPDTQQVTGHVDTVFEVWVPPENAENLKGMIKKSLESELGSNIRVFLSPTNVSSNDPLGPLKIVLSVISALILSLGVLGLINIAVVTVKQRVREIGIRRSFGASGGRVFTSIMLESVVGTTIAGFIGVLASVIIMSLPIVQSTLVSGLATKPGFPVTSAITGFTIAVGVGALAGLIPALVAVRVKVIDAIRF